MNGHPGGTVDPQWWRGIGNKGGQRLGCGILTVGGWEGPELEGGELKTLEQA